mgnify:CR=1 FL=1
MTVDEHLAGYCSEITVTLNDDGTATIIYNGRGIPIGIHPKAGIPAVEVVFTVLHAGGKFGDGGYKISGGLHGVGASVVNALSVWLEVEIRVDGGVYKQRYERGKVAAPLEKIGTCRKSDTGTKVTFLPDGEIFEKTRFKSDAIKAECMKQLTLILDLQYILRIKEAAVKKRLHILSQMVSGHM